MLRRMLWTHAERVADKKETRKGAAIVAVFFLGFPVIGVGVSTWDDYSQRSALTRIVQLIVGQRPAK